MKKMILIDGNSLMFRAYYATAYTGNLMQTKSGMYTNALFGFVNMLSKILQMEDLTNIFIAFDKDKKTFRHRMYDDYKGGRAHMPDELGMQINLIKEYIDVLGIKQFECDDFEADDLICTFANKAKDSVDEVLVISGDKDLLQLVNDKVTVALTKKGITELEYYRPDNFKDLMGVLPTQITDYKGLIGDNSDNLPGVTGVGPKTAQKLLNEYHTLENVFANVDKMSGKLALMLTQDKEISLRTKLLATLRSDATLPYEVEDTVYQEVEYDRLRSFYEKVEFTSFIKKMTSSEQPKDASKIIKNDNAYMHEYHFNNLNYLVELLKTNTTKNLLIEVELDGENYHKSDILGFSLFVKEEGFYFEKSYLYNDEIIKILNSDYSFACIDSKKTYCALQKCGIKLTNITFDLLLSCYCLDPTLPNQDLHNLFNYFLNYPLPYIDDIYGKKNIYQIPDTSIIVKYAIDKLFGLSIVQNIIDLKLEENKQKDLFYDIELPLATILADIELAGFKVSKKRLEEIGLFLTNELKNLEQKIYDLVGHEFNIGSPKQLGIILFDELNLGKGKKNKTGYSTSADILEELAHKHDVPRLVLEYRKYAKLYSTYVVGLINELGADSKVRTTFKQALTLTGRLSSTEPNIQNIPVRTEDGRLIRSAFIPSNEDGYLVSGDYSQIELRILASVSHCSSMIKDFNDGLDFHSSTAAKIYEIPENMVTKDLRRIAKAVNFGIIYGMSDWGLSEQIHITPSEANRFIEKYFKIYPEIKTYLDNTITEAREKGYSETIFNRRRYMPEIKSSNHTLRKFAERTAMNAPIQGAAADIMKLAMISVANRFKELNLQSKIVAQVHDELIIDCVHDELEIVKKELARMMNKAIENSKFNYLSFDVKLDTDVEEGTTWDLK